VLPVESSVAEMVTSAVLVHAGWKTASEVRVKMEDAPSVRTPSEGRVNGVQRDAVDDEVLVVLGKFQRSRRSIAKRIDGGPAAKS
jgi:hypothetical protein